MVFTGTQKLDTYGSQFHASVELTLILLLPILKSRHRLTDAWPADCAYLLSVACRTAYSQNAFVVSLKADHNFLYRKNGYV